MPWHEIEINDDSPCSVLEIESESMEDCANQEDLLVAITPYPDMLKNALAEAMFDSALRPLKLGAAVGGGTGQRYSYIELALTDVDRAWEEIRLILQDGHLPTRTWLLFHDEELSCQWRGLYDDSPSPPMRAPEPD
jgi:hypothetical protein